MSIFSWLFRKQTYPKKDLSEPLFDVPNQDLIKVEFKVAKLDDKVLGNTISGGDRLIIRISDYFEEPTTSQENKDAQLLETCLHELFHCFLWLTSYTHSNDKSSMLYYKVYGKNLSPVTEWDKKTIQEIANSVNRVEVRLNFDKDRYKKIYSGIYTACVNWNKFLGKRMIFLIT